MALSADRITLKKVPGEQSYPMASNTTIYAGGLVCINSSGFAVPGATTSGNKTVGVAKKGVVNPSGGSERVAVEAPIVARFKASSITQAMVGTMMMVIDDETFDDAGANSIKAGILVEFISTTEGWIYIDPALNL